MGHGFNSFPIAFFSIEYEGRLMLLEIAQVPPDYVDGKHWKLFTTHFPIPTTEFKSVSKFR